MNPSSRRVFLRHIVSAAGAIAGTSLLAACGASAASGALSAAGTTASASVTSSAVPTASKGAATTHVASVASTAAPAASGGGQKANVYWFSRDAPKKEAQDALIKPWQDAHPNWVLTVDTGINDDKLATLVAAGQQIDVITWYQTARMVNLSLNLFIPLDSYVARDHFDTTQYSQPVLEMVGKVDGKLYAIPYAYGGDAPFGMVYNRNIFQAAGVAEPPQTWDAAWSWDQFTQAVVKLTKREGDTQSQVGLASYGFYVNTIPLIWKPASWLQDDYKTITCDSPEMISAYQKYLDVVLKDRASSSSPGADLGKGDPFYGGKAAITAPCCSALNYAKSMPPSIEWALAPMPKGTVTTPDVQAVIGGLGVLGKERDAGWSLLQYLLQESRFANAVNRQPAVPADVATWVDANFKDWPDANAKNIIVGGTRIALPIDPIRFHPKYNEMSKSIIAPAWDSMSKGKETAEQALKRIKEPLQTMANS